ncbi:MAG: protein-glutamate O-methyltransferase CheR [Gammaproteobacteria bacterium]
MSLLTSSQFSRFRKLTHDLTGVTIAKTRRSMLNSRIASRLRALKMDDVDTYYELVNNDAAERALFIHRVTTHETYFFRTQRVWDYVANDFLPSWYERQPGQTCRVWSAAASYGEEAYSTAMLMQEFATKHADFRFDIHGSDISTEAIKKAQLGVYQGRNIQRLRDSHPELLKRYLVEKNDGHQVERSIQDKVSFSTHNLFTEFRYPYKFDLILCRNVLIYFDRDDQAKVLKNLKQALAEDGVLIIGESENLNQFGAMFEPLESLAYRAVPTPAQRSEVSIESRDPELEPN